MKTLYYIEFKNYDTAMSHKIAISKKEYDTQLKFLKQQVEDTREDDLQMLMSIHSKEFDTYTATAHRFDLACSSTYLSCYKCKENYTFKRN